MKMKKLLATALILLMSMMACVPAFAEEWDYTIIETIDCTGFAENKTGSGWEWDNTTKTLKIKDNLLIKITQKAGNENYGIKLPGGATLEIQKNLLVDFVAEGENFGAGYGVYSEGEITINGTLRTVREGGDIFAVAAQKVTLGKDAQISAPSCAGVVTPELVVDGNNTIIADYSCIKNNNNVEITGSGTLTLDCGDKPIDCKRYTVGLSVKLKFIASPVPKERITYTIPDSLNNNIQVTHADGEGKMTVSIGEMNSNAWATAIEEALKDSFSGEISSIGFNINKAKLPTGAAKWMHVNGNIFSDDQFSGMVLNSDDDIWDKSSSDFFGWNFTLADVTEEGDNYIVTPAKYDDEYIYMAWKDSSDNVIRVEKLNVVVTNSVGQITVPKENVARPVPVGNGQLKFNTNNASHIEKSYDESAGLLKYAITDMDAVKKASANEVLEVNTEVSAPDGYDMLTIVDSKGSTQSSLPATISVPYADKGELATNEYPFKLIWKDSKDSAKELTQILNIRITVKNATWMDEHWTPVSEGQLDFIPNIADIKNNGMPLTLEKGKGDSSKVTCIHARFNKGLTLQNVLNLNQSYVEIKAPEGKNIVGYRQNNSGGNDPEGYVEYNNYTASLQDSIIKAAELNNSTTAQFKFVPFSSFVTPEGITVYYAPKQGYVRLIDWYDEEENIVERQYLYFLMVQADFTVNTKTVAEVNETPSQPTLKDGTASEKDWALVCQKNPQEGTNAFYVELKVVDGNGEETKEIKEHFENNGSKSEIFLPFFDYGINPEDAKNGRLKFTLTHYKDGIDKAGTEIKYRLDESGTGIWFSTDSFSPFTVKWETVSGGEKPSGSGSGSGSSVWYRGGNSLGASIPSDPTEVLIDGVSVPFTVDGNTITIPSLTDGPHNVKVIWRGGSYSFNITASGTGKSIVALPKTGDSSMGPYVGLCMLVFMGMLAGGAVLNRKKAK